MCPNYFHRWIDLEKVLPPDGKDTAEWANSFDLQGQADDVE